MSMSSSQITGVEQLNPQTLGSALRWYAVTVHHQHEKTIARHLTDVGMESFLPLYRTKRTWSDRVKELDIPLFPRFVFARYAFQNRANVLRIPGVRGIVGFGKETAYISETEIAALKSHGFLRPSRTALAVPQDRRLGYGSPADPCRGSRARWCARKILGALS